MHSEKTKAKGEKMEELDLKELFDMVWSRKTTIILIILICAVIGFIYTMNFTKPVYSTSTTLLLASTNNTQNNNTVTVGDITVNSKLVSTYSRLIKSRKVIEQVNSNLSMTVNTSNIAVNATKRNRINRNNCNKCKPRK